MLLSNGLALKFKQAIPLVEGAVTSVENGHIRLNLKACDGIKEHMKIIIYKIEQGESMQIPIIKGEGRLAEVDEDCSIAILLKQLDNGISITSEDRVITK